MKPIALFLTFYTAIAFSFQAVRVFKPSCAWLVCLAIVSAGAVVAGLIWTSQKELE